MLFKVTQTETYLDTLLENSFLPLITLPTRIGLNSVTILDHICTNIADDSFDSGIIVSDISDHFPGLYIRSFKDKFIEKKSQQKTRKFDSESIFKFKTFFRTFRDQWPNLKNLSGGLNLSRGLNMVGFTYNCIKCFKI